MFDADEFEVEFFVVQLHHRVDGHFAEKLAVVGNELALEGGLRAPHEHIAQRVHRLGLVIDRQLVDFAQ